MNIRVSLQVSLCIALLTGIAIADELSPTRVFTEYVQKRNSSGAAPVLEYLAMSLRAKATRTEAFPGNLRVDNLKVLAEKINGDHATLSVSGAMQDPLSAAMSAATTAMGGSVPKVSQGTILFVREDGSWKIEQENWLTEMGNRKATPVTAAATSAAAAQKLGSYEWCWQAPSTEFPKTPVSGSIAGVPFKPTKVHLDHGLRDRLIIENGDMFNGTSIEIVLGDPLPSQSNQKYTVGRNSDSFKSPDIHLRISSEKRPTVMQIFSAADNYGMRLSFGQQKGDLLPGYIVLRLPYKQSYVQGYFYAKLTDIPHN